MIYDVDKLKPSPTCLSFLKYRNKVSYSELIEFVLCNLGHFSFDSGFETTTIGVLLKP